MTEEVLSENAELLIRRLTLKPGEATSWHQDNCRRFTVVVKGERLKIEFLNEEERTFEVALGPGECGWDEPENRVHRAINSGATEYHEVVTFYKLEDLEVQTLHTI